MALIPCPECGREVSSAARACPNCGYPVAENMLPVEPQPRAAPADRLLAEVRPSWWRYFGYLVFGWLILPLLVAWSRRASVVLRVYPGRVVIEEGIFSKRYQEFLARDIRSIVIDQSFLARLVGIGDLTISTAATVDAAQCIEGVPNPAAVRDLILAERAAC